MSKTTLTPEQLDALRRWDTCTISNVIETFNVRLRNEGFMDWSVRSMFPKLPPMTGYAATLKIRCSSPPTEGAAYPDRTDWWMHVLATPPPRVVVIQDVDRAPGKGALIGAVHATILASPKCAGVVTNGAVRDLPAVEALGLPLFAGGVAVSHSYVHIVEVAGMVEIGGLKVQPGDLLHGDSHGVLSIPEEIAARIPSRARRMVENERELMDLCRSPGFSLETLREAVKALAAPQD